LLITHNSAVITGSGSDTLTLPTSCFDGSYMFWSFCDRSGGINFLLVFWLTWQ